MPRSAFTQTSQIETKSAGCQATRPTFTFDDIEENNSKVLFFTGIPDSGTFKSLFDELEDGISSTHMGRPKSLRLVDEFFMVLMRLRLGLLLEDLSVRFNISVTTCSAIFNRWIDYLDKSLNFLVKWPSKKHQRYNACAVSTKISQVPGGYRLYRDSN